MKNIKISSLVKRGSNIYNSDIIVKKNMHIQEEKKVAVDL